MSQDTTYQATGGILDEAITWHVRLNSGDVNEQDLQRHAAWLLADPRHVDAFEQVQETWDKLKPAQDAVLQHFDTDPVPATDTVVVGPWRRQVVRIAALAASLLLVAITAWQLILAEPETRSFRTLAGESLEIELEDGSVVDLDTGTEIAVTMTEAERVVTLVRGAAVFAVAGNGGRPFVVKTDWHDVRVLGTRFEVVRRNGEMSVSVVEGTVAVAPSGPIPSIDSPKDLMLEQGERLVFDEKFAAPERYRVDPDRIAMWRDGQLAFANEPLRDVVKALNRYFETEKIVIGDSSIGSIPFTGVLEIADSETMARRLSGILPVKFERNGGEVRLIGASTE